MKRIYLILVMALVFSMFFGQAGQVNAESPKSTVEYLSTEQLVDDSDVVAVGNVSSTSSRWNDGHTLILTDVTVSVENVLKGDKTLRQAKITQVGGRVGDITLQVSGAASFVKNEKAVLFLKNDSRGSFSTVGGKQGKQMVEKGKVDSKTKLDDYTGAIQQIVSQKSNARTSRVPANTSATLNSTTETATTTATLTETPTISGMQPSTGSAGTNSQVTINGSGFGATAGSVTFYYRSGQPLINAPIVSWSDTSVVVIVPVGIINGYSATASSGPVQVTTAGGVSNNYQFGVTFSSLGVKWAGDAPQVHFNVNPSWVTGADTALQSAAQTWNNTGAAFGYVYDGTTTVTSPGYDGINEIMSANLGSGILASTYSWWDGSNSMREFDMVFNTYYPWSTTGAAGAFDTQSIATHELGHALGLRDLYGNSGTPNDTAKIMYGYGSTALKRNLTAGDAAGILWTYPAAAPDPVPPVIIYNPATFSFTADEGGTNPANQIVNIRNGGDGTINWSLIASDSWLTVSPASGTAGVTDSPVTIEVNTSGLAAGSYSGTITVTAAGATNSPVSVPVALTINQVVPEIANSPATFSFTADEDGTNPASQVLNIHNSGTGSLDWAATASDSWLTLSPASGIASEADSPVTVEVNTSGMTAGSYAGMITISAAGAINSPVTVPVALTINPALSPLGEALDNPNLVWTTMGNSVWFPQTTKVYYGDSAAQSGNIAASQSSSLLTSVSGSGTLSFYWSVSSRAGSGYLRLYIDGTLKAQISGSVNWQKKSYTLGSGEHVIEWRYTRDSSTKTSGSNCGWVDKVQFN